MVFHNTLCNISFVVSLNVEACFKCFTINSWKSHASFLSSGIVKCVLVLIAHFSVSFCPANYCPASLCPALHPPHHPNTLPIAANCLLYLETLLSTGCHSGSRSTCCLHIFVLICEFVIVIVNEIDFLLR